MTIPGFTSTGSKRPEALFGASHDVPMRLRRARGCRVWDVAGREYVDTVMALGAVALGYAHPAVVEAVTRAAEHGGVGSLAPELEEEVAAVLADRLPGAESVRFFKTGAEAVAGAVRVARVATGREHVITCGYHGWLDWCQESPGVPACVRELRREIPFNSAGAVSSALAEFAPVAAVVIEPVVDAPPEHAWLEALRVETEAAGAVLIFDEIKTAFRVAVGGIAETRGIRPDLVVVGKAMGNGVPIAAVAGRAAVMEHFTRTWVSSTLATETIGLAAARAVLEVFASEPVVAHLARAGERLYALLENFAKQYGDALAGVRGIPQMCYLAFHDAEQSGAVARAAAARGLLFKRSAYNFVSLAHDDDALGLVAERLGAALEATLGC
jgi:glutamate-1-semialdehyde 2,1-aminomutase